MLQASRTRTCAWVARHLEEVSQTFAKLAVTAADITSLLRKVEEDQTLVHAAYYTDDECIARIADGSPAKSPLSGDVAYPIVSLGKAVIPDCATAVSDFKSSDWARSYTCNRH